MKQQIRFCTTSDGVRIAYASVGEGPPVVRVLGWLGEHGDLLDQVLEKVGKLSGSS